MPLRNGSSPIAFEGQLTGDGRIIAPGALRWEGDAWPFAWTPEDRGWHDGAVDVGAISSMTRNGDAIAADYGVDTDGTHGAEVARQYDAGIPLGISIDLDDITVELVDMTVEIVDEDGTTIQEGDDDLALAASGALARPAAARLHVDHMTFTFALEALTADGVVVAEMSTGDFVERVTDGRIRRATIVSVPAFAGALLRLDPADGEATEATDDAATGEPVAASAGASGCGCGGSCGHCDGEGVTAAAGGERRMFSGPRLPRADYFNDPGFGEATPLDISEKGIAFGHVAAWNTCHTGSPAGECIRAPHSLASYAYYRTGARPTTAGRVPVGQLTIGGGHADLALSYRGAAEHYDNATNALADVACGEDAYGIWFAGALRPGVSDDDVIAMLASSLSGDWRSIGGHLEMIAAHAVNVPGFPIARVASGAPTALVAAGCLPPRAAASDRLHIDGMVTADQIRAAVREVFAERDRREAAPARARLARLGDARNRARLRRVGAVPRT